MLSPAQRHVLEIRLQILDTLESLITHDSTRDYYDERLSDFAINSTPQATRAELALLEGNEIASFIIPIGVTEADFREAPIRIKKINREKLQAAQKSVREELGTAKPAATSNVIQGNGDSPDISMPSPIITPAEIALYLGI